MARKGLLYYLFSVNKKPLYVDENNHVQEGNDDFLKPNGQPAHLQFSPDGWNDSLVKYARNIKYWGLFRDMTVAMKFVKDGAKILRNRMWLYGMECICFLGISKLDRYSLPYKYEPWYLSEINFSKLKDTSINVVVEALEGGMSKFLKAYESTIYEIPIQTDPEAKNVLTDGMEFDFNTVYSIGASQEIRGTEQPYYLDLFITSHEGDASNVPFQNILFQPSTTYPNDNWILRDEIGRDFRLHGTVKILFNRAVTANIRAEVDDGHGSGILSINQTLLVNQAGAIGATVDVPFDFTISVANANRMHVKVFGGSSTDTNIQFTILGGELRIDYVYRHPPSIQQGLYPYRVIEKLVEKMTNGQFGIKSDWLLAKKDMLVISGDSLRGINPSNIRTSLLDAFKSLFANTIIRLSVENNKLVIEPFATAFTSGVIIDLGEVSNAEVSIAEDIIGNTIKGGYPEQDYTDVNGKFEFNQGVFWSTIGTKIIREINIQSIWRADPLGIELLRINFDKKTTTDSDSDNDTFVLNIKTIEEDLTGTGIMGYKLYRPAYTSFTGLIHWQTSFNTEWTPKKNLLRAGAYLHSILDYQDDEKIKFTSADKNSDISTTLDGVTVTEKEDIQIGSLAPKLFRPYYLTFTTQVPVNLLKIIEANPYGKVKFTWNKQVWYGFLWEGGIKPATNDKQTWKLISAPENDLIKFNEPL